MVDFRETELKRIDPFRCRFHHKRKGGAAETDLFSLRKTLRSRAHNAAGISFSYINSFSAAERERNGHNIDFSFFEAMQKNLLYRNIFLKCEGDTPERFRKKVEKERNWGNPHRSATSWICRELSRRSFIAKA